MWVLVSIHPRFCCLALGGLRWGILAFMFWITTHVFLWQNDNHVPCFGFAVVYFFLFGLLYESCGNTRNMQKPLQFRFWAQKKGGSPFRHPKAELEDAELSKIVHIAPCGEVGLPDPFHSVAALWPQLVAPEFFVCADCVEIILFVRKVMSTALVEPPNWMCWGWTPIFVKCSKCFYQWKMELEYDHPQKITGLEPLLVAWWKVRFHLLDQFITYLSLICWKRKHRLRRWCWRQQVFDVRGFHISWRPGHSLGRFFLSRKWCRWS